MSEEICVLCNSKIKSKKELQDHFRKHANKEIDKKGRPVAKILTTRPHPNKEMDQLGCHSPKLAAIEKYQACSIISKSPVKLQTGPGKNSNDMKTFKSELARQNVPCITKISDSHQQHLACDVCHIYFESVASAITHRWRQHPNLPVKFNCSHCGIQFPLQTMLDVHIAEEHRNSTPQEVLNCDECEEKFSSKSSLNNHSNVSHKRSAHDTKSNLVDQAEETEIQVEKKTTKSNKQVVVVKSGPKILFMHQKEKEVESGMSGNDDEVAICANKTSSLETRRKRKSEVVCKNDESGVKQSIAKRTRSSKCY